MPFTTNDYDYISSKKGYEGQIATEVPNTLRGQYFATTAIPFGRALTWDTPGETVRIVSAIDDPIIGISVMMSIYEQELVDGDAAYPPLKALNFMTTGEMIVIAEEDIDITTSNAVHVRCIASGSPTEFERIGRYRATADGVNTQLLAGAYFMNSAVAGEPVRIHVNPLPLTV